MKLTYRHSILLLFPLLAACAQAPQRAAGDSSDLIANADKQHLEKIIEPPKLDLPNVALTDRLLYEFLLGDIAAQRGRSELAAQAYLDLAKTTRDPRVAKRAAQLSFEAHQYEQSVEAFDLWQQLEPGSPMAKQMLVSLLLSGGKLQEAQPRAAELLASDPENVGRTLMNIYGLLGRVQDKAAALDWFTRVVQPYPQVAEAHWALAQLAAAANKNDVALSEAHQAVALRPDWDLAVVLEAQLLMRDEPQKSIALLKNYLDKNGENKEVRLIYARLLLEQKQYAEARDEFGKLLQQRPGSPELAFAIALISLQMGELDRADKELRLALASDDKNKDENTLHYYLGQLSEAKKDDAGALQHYRQISGGEHDFLAHLRIAYLLNKSGRLDEARKALQAAEPKDDAQRVQLLMIESQFLREAKQFEESFKVLTRGLEKFPDQPELLYQSALIAEKLNKHDTFEQLARKLIKVEPDNAHAYNALGYSWLERNVRIPEAMALVEKAYKMMPDDAAIIDSMGWGYFRQGKLDKSLEFLNRAYKANPDPEIAAHLGEVMWRQGDQEGARKVWTDSAKANPDNDALNAVMKRFIP
ncbi:MAG: tetratricopeptide repeat protein [Sideroxydans sp.]|nr:tetratricopeptide repeat protein [Sideroxydans sp.]